jgi:hypothetical protein
MHIEHRGDIAHVATGVVDKDVHPSVRRLRDVDQSLSALE